MTDTPTAAEVLVAATTLERLQEPGAVTNQKSYSPRDLRNIAALFDGKGER